jgi:hypothetical protein
MPRLGYIPFIGDACARPQLAPVGDTSSVVCFERTWDDTIPGGPQGPHVPGQEYDVATIQVGRTVVVMEIARTIFGKAVATDAEVAGIMTRLADRAERALREAGDR